MIPHTTPFHPEQSPQPNEHNSEFSHFSITTTPPPQASSFPLNRQQSDPNFHPNPSKKRTDGILPQQQVQTAAKQTENSLRTHKHNPELEIAIYDLYSEMRSMLDKMGNLMNVYMKSTSNHSSELPFLPTGSDNQYNRHHNQSSMHHYGHFGHLLGGKHEINKSLTSKSNTDDNTSNQVITHSSRYQPSNSQQYPPIINSSAGSYQLDNEQYPQHLTTTNNESNSQPIKTILSILTPQDGPGGVHLDGHQEQIIFEPLHNSQKQPQIAQSPTLQLQQQSLLQANSLQTGLISMQNQPHHIKHTIFSPEFGDVEDDVVDDDVLCQNSNLLKNDQSTHVSARDATHSPSESTISSHSTGIQPKGTVDNKESDIALGIGSNSQQIQLQSQSTVDIDYQMSLREQHQLQQRMRERELEVLYNRTNGIQFDETCSQQSLNDCDSISILDIALLAQHAKSSYQSTALLKNKSTGTVEGELNGMDNVLKGEIGEIGDGHDLFLEGGNGNKSQDDVVGYFDNNSNLTPDQSSKSIHPRNIPVSSSNPHIVLVKNSQQGQRGAGDGINNSSIDSTSSLQIDDSDDLFFTMLLRKNSKDPPQLLSDYNVHTNMTKVYKFPMKKTDGFDVIDGQNNNNNSNSNENKNNKTFQNSPIINNVSSIPIIDRNVIAQIETNTPIITSPQSHIIPQITPIETPYSSPPLNNSITPSLFQDSRLYNPVQTITELEFSKIEPVLANLRLCNPHPLPHRTSSGVSNTRTGGEKDGEVKGERPRKGESEENVSGGVKNRDTSSTMSNDVQTSLKLDHETGKGGMERNSAHNVTVPTSHRPNTVLPVATIPTVVTAPSLSQGKTSMIQNDTNYRVDQNDTEKRPKHSIGVSTSPPQSTVSASKPPLTSPFPSPSPVSNPLPNNYSLLPKKKWSRIRIGIDVGGTLAKICYFAPRNPIPAEIALKQRLDSYLIAHHPVQMNIYGSNGGGIEGSISQPSNSTTKSNTLSARRAQELEIDSDDLHGTLHFVKFQTTSIKHFFDLVNLEGLGHVELFATGGGAHKYRDDFLQMVAQGDKKGVSEDQGKNNVQNNNNNNNTHENTEENNQNHIQPASQTETIPTKAMFQVVDEMSSLVRGVAFLIKHSPVAECFSFKRYLFHQELEMYSRSPPSFPFLLVNIGSGVSILRVDNEKEYTRVGGSSLGGGTFLGLCRALTGCSSFQEALSLAHKGKGSKVDLLVNDIYGRDYSSLGLSGDTIAASFGKLVKMVDDTSVGGGGGNEQNRGNGNGSGHHELFNPYVYGITREDLAKSALVMITNNICSLAHLYARQVLKVPSVVFVGNFLRNNILAMRMLSYALAYWSNNTIEAIFLKHEGYFGAVGTFFDDANNL